MYEDVEQIRPGLYIKKGTSRRVFPIIKEVPGKLALNNIHWKNLVIGNGFNLLVIALVLLSCLLYVHDTKECLDLIENPCSYISQFKCDKVTDYSSEAYNDWEEFNDVQTREVVKYI